MTDILVTSEIGVFPIQTSGGDWLVADAARVSTGTAGTGERIPTKADEGLIRSLVRHRHSSPFQHGQLTFLIYAPIFVFREWRTHRIAMIQSVDDYAYSESSARYRPLSPVFWVPRPNRPLVKPSNFSAMKPVFDPAPADHYEWVISELKKVYQLSWDTYESLIHGGTAPEVARAILGTGVYSSMYVTCNPWSLMHFLSLRTHDEEATFESYPQLEIEEAARKMEIIFRHYWPVTYAAFSEFGRTA